MNQDFDYLSPSIIDDLYEEPTELNIHSFDDFLNLPLNDLYIKKNGNDPSSFAKYKPKEPEPVLDPSDIVIEPPHAAGVPPPDDHKIVVDVPAEVSKMTNKKFKSK